MNPYENSYMPKRGFPFAILATFLIIISLGLIGVSAYLFVQKEEIVIKLNPVIENAEKEVRAEVLSKYQEEFDEYITLKTRTFTSNSDFGSVSFEYPKEWSVYNDLDGSGKNTTTYTAYFSPNIVMPVTEKSEFKHALEVKIFKATFETIKESYKSKLSKNLVRIQPYNLKNEVMEEKGQKITGFVLNKNEVDKGTIIQFVMRDKVIQFYLMQPEYESVFNDLIIKTLRWSK